MKLTAAAAHAAQPGDVLKDHVVPGLRLRARSSVKSWHYYYFLNGKERNPKIGEFPTILIETARELAKDLAKRVARGEDPSAEKQEYRAATTVAELATLYKQSRKFQTRKPRTQNEYERLIRLHIVPAFGQLKAKDVATSDVDRALQKITDAGHPVAANRTRDVLSAMFTLAESNDLSIRPPNTNPVKSSIRNPEFMRRRHMGESTGDEFLKIAKALDDLERQWPSRVAALRVMLLAGTRVTELITARREDLRGKFIMLDEHKTDRTGEPRIIVLPDQALAILAAIPDDGSGFLFGRGMTRHHVTTVWQKARETAGCVDLRVQDFRRTFASAALSRGVGLDAIGQLFGHRDSKTTRRYAWLENAAADSATQGTADLLTKRLDGSPASN